MKVFTLESHVAYEGCALEGVFATKEEAEAARDAASSAEDYSYVDDWLIKEWTLPDSPAVPGGV